jgi:hypothetical protein
MKCVERCNIAEAYQFRDIDSVNIPDWVMQALANGKIIIDDNTPEECTVVLCGGFKKKVVKGDYIIAVRYSTHHKGVDLWHVDQERFANEFIVMEDE